MIEIIKDTYPNGKHYKVIRFANIWNGGIGTYAIEENGFLPSGCKKIRTEKEAILWTVKKYKTELEKDLQELDDFIKKL